MKSITQKDVTCLKFAFAVGLFGCIVGMIATVSMMAATAWMIYNGRSIGIMLILFVIAAFLFVAVTHSFISGVKEWLGDFK